MSRLRPLAWIFSLTAGASLALAIVTHRVHYFPLDLAIARRVQSTDFGALTYLFTALNALGFAPVVTLSYGGVIALMFLAHRRWEAIVCSFGVIGGAGLNFLFKLLVARPRPSPHLIHVEHRINNGSFPAGHVLNFTIFAGLMCCFAWMNMRPSWRRTTLVCCLTALMLMMGVARISAGEHWPSDVLGGYLIGVLWLAVSIPLYCWGRDRLAVGARHADGVVPTLPL